METKENKGNIEELSEKVGKNGNFYHLKIGGLSYSVFKDTDAYDQLLNKEINLGDYVSLDYTETAGTYQGKPITYKNAVCFEKQLQPSPVFNTNTKEVSSDVWEAKDRRIARMNALSAAIETCKMNQCALPDEAQMVNEKVIMGLAEIYVEWIYRKGSESK